MNLKMRLKTVVAILAVMTLTVNAQETTPTMHLTLDKAIELALSVPIQISTDPWIFAPPRSFSQLITSFFGS